MKKLFYLFLIVTLSLTGCAFSVPTPMPTSEPTPEPTAEPTPEPTPITYRQISTQEAVDMMAKEKGYIILDVRREDEYAAGHIPGAILIPNETIGTEDIPQLPDKNQLILVYCRSGNRSKQASEKLVKLGYTNIVEFGGINSWTGEIITD